MKKAAKGTAGYIRYEKIRRTIITAVMFGIPLMIYFTGLAITHTRKNLFTLVAILGILPAAKLAVNWIMILLQKPAQEETVRETQAQAKGLVQAYELTVTAYEGSMPLEAAVICGNEVVCYSSRGDRSKFAFMEKHMAKILSSNGYYGVRAKIFGERKAFLERVGQLAKDPEKYRENIPFKPDEAYPDLSREELIRHVLLQISV